MSAAGLKRKTSEPDGAPKPPSHRIISGDELGLLKVTEVPHGNAWEGAVCSTRWGQPDKGRAIQQLKVHCPDWESGECLVVSARSGGLVELCSGADGQVVAAYSLLASSRGGGAAARGSAAAAAAAECRALHLRPSGDASAPSIFAAMASGAVALHRPSAASAAAGHGAGSGSVVRAWEEACSFKTIDNLLAMDASSSGRSVAVGGDGHQLSVWDLEGGAATQVFKGKAGKASRSGLQDLPHVTALTYVAGQDEKQIVVGTSKQKLWLYDLRAGKKPQAEVQWTDGRITALEPQPDGAQVWVGNGRGQVQALDLRAFKQGPALKGSAGAIRGLALHPTHPVMASVGLDRHLRLHSTPKRTLLAKAYLKQLLTGVAWMPPPPKPVPQQQAGQEAATESAAKDADGGSADGSGGARTGHASQKKKHAKKHRSTHD